MGVAHTYHEALTPIVGRKDGELTFHMDPVGTHIFSLSSDRKDDDATQLSMLETASWVLSESEMPAPAAPRAKRDSISSLSSTNTIWPSYIDNRPAEQDEFGHAIDLKNTGAGDAARLARCGHTDPNELELGDFEEQPSGSFKHERVRPIGPLPTALPHRPTTGRRLA
ncbi:elongation factor 3 [Diplocarpon rosae]|nr:elongation factor 3 [Diplocarpon rosae]